MTQRWSRSASRLTRFVLLSATVAFSAALAACALPLNLVDRGAVEVTPTAAVESPAASDGSGGGGQAASTCDSYLRIRLSAPGPHRGYLPEKIEDHGSSEYASGPVGYDADGQVETYTIQPGDTMVGIGERFCIDYVTVAVYNDIYPTWEISAGEQITLRP